MPEKPNLAPGEEVEHVQMSKYGRSSRDQQRLLLSSRAPTRCALREHESGWPQKCILDLTSPLLPGVRGEHVVDGADDLIHALDVALT